ncbi:MAG: CapA family protein [Fimbriimonadaceae bacterium]
MLLALALAQSSWTLVAGGDIMTNGVPVSARPFRSIAAVTRPVDIAIANLEIPLTNLNTRTTRKSAAAIRSRSQFVLKGDPGHGAGIKGAGFDIVSLGNNHAMDFQAGGLKQMIGVLDRQGISYAGAGITSREAYRPAVFTLPNGIKVGMISALAFMNQGSLAVCTPATPTTAGIAVINSNGGTVGQAVKRKIRSWVGRARNESDFVIAGLHWGIERQNIPTRFQVSLARAFIDGGADLVWGHHPHVLQGAEIYRGKPILYSMGNLLSPLPADTGLLEMAFSGTALKSARFHPARIGGGRVILSAAKAIAAGRERFRKLCAAVARQYPSSNSRPFQVH